ncbi:MAG TPA: hypothetical protein PKY12_09160, partial [Catalimonadaceae bacterium]|nr:hypothetical protein [Catalimonadaceae bacterium]
MGTLQNRNASMVILLSSALLCFNGSANAQIQDSIRQKVQRFLQTQSLAYPLLAQSTKEIGHRLTASKNGAAAENFVFQALKSAGINDVSFDPFSVKAWQRQSCQL